MTMKYVDRADLHEEDFLIQGGKIRTRANRNHYPVTWGSGFAPWTTNEGDLRGKAIIQDGVGIIHLDFKRPTGTATNVATLPNNCPTPAGLIETQLWDGATIYISPGTRTIIATGLTNNRRYIVDLVGFFG